jgi:hypothetical protein
MGELEQGELELEGGSAPDESEPEIVEPAEESAEAAPAEEPAPKPDRYEEQLREEREARIRLEERLAAREAAEKPVEKEEPAVLTRAQLRAAVNEGQIDEDQMEEIWATQQRNIQRKDLEELLDTRDKQRESVTRVSSETQKYIDAYPGVSDQNSEEWRKVKKEYDYLISLGDEHNDATQLKALRAAFGPSDRARPKERTAERREAVSETATPGSSSGARPVDIFNQIPQKYRAYTKSRYEEGQISLEEIEKDLPYMKRLAH